MNTNKKKLESSKEDGKFENKSGASENEVESGISEIKNKFEVIEPGSRGRKDRPDVVQSVTINKDKSGRTSDKTRRTAKSSTVGVRVQCICR